MGDEHFLHLLWIPPPFKLYFLTIAMICSIFFSFQGSSFLDSEYKHSRYSTVLLHPTQKAWPFPNFDSSTYGSLIFPWLHCKAFWKSSLYSSLLLSIDYSCLHTIHFGFIFLSWVRNCSLSELSTMVSAKSWGSHALQSTEQPVVKWNVTERSSPSLEDMYQKLCPLVWAH